MGERLDVNSIRNHAEVYEIYRDIIEYPGLGGKRSRGQKYYKEGDVHKFINSPIEYMVTKDHVRETTFNAAQELYNDILRLTIRNSLINSEKGLLARFKASWNQNPLKENFEKYLSDSFLGSLFDAFETNINLIPGFYGFLVTTHAGSDGLQFALREGVYPRVTEQNGRDPYLAFVGIDVDKTSGSEHVISEMQCAAPALALKIIKEVEKCLEYSGQVKDDMELFVFSGPSTDIATGIENYLNRRMIDLGYNPVE